jgi:hypothetical protein
LDRGYANFRERPFDTPFRTRAAGYNSHVGTKPSSRR